MNRYHLAVLALIPVIVVLLLASVAHSEPIGAQVSAAKICRDSRGRFIKCPAPIPTPTPTPVPAPVPPDSTAAPLTPITDNFNTADGIITASWGIPPSMGVDPDGAFRFICAAGQIRYDDPIVLPGQPGKSHLHQFYGNLSADASSTYQSLRTVGDSTCSYSGAPVNRSGYWIPAMLDGAGHVVLPDYVAIYYKRHPASSRECTISDAHQEGICVGIPTGLRFVTGYNMATGTSNAHPFFYCQDSATVTGTHSTLHDNIPQVIPDCASGARLTINIGSPDCWNGKDLDSPDHRSHMAYGSAVWNGVESVYKCPATHPYVIPQLSVISFYTTDANFMAGKWHLSSDEMVAGSVPGSTMHADYWEAWSPVVRDTWLAHCIDGHLICAGGDLGNGTAIKGQTVPTANPRLVPIP
jgi:hypothetical protein